MSNSENKNDPQILILKDEENLVLDHNYDGIKELDNPLPQWWLAIFYLTISFSIVYVGYYMVGPGPSLTDELNVALAEIEQVKKDASAKQGPMSDQIIMERLKSTAAIQLGSEVYLSKCFACHGDKGQGVVGPNLTDDNWIHGSGNPSEVAKIIADGVLDKGMPNWSAVLSSDEIINVTAFIRSIHGTKPAGGKVPEGPLYPFKEIQ